MFGKQRSRSYKEFDDEDEEEEEEEEASPGFFGDAVEDLEREETNDNNSQDAAAGAPGPPPRGLSRACVKSFLTVLLISIYVLLTAVALFLVYQTISDFLSRLRSPVMSVSYKEVDAFPPPGIALYPGDAELLSCRHHYHDFIPPLAPGRPSPGDCESREVTYVGPFTNQTQRRAVVVRGPTDVRNKELVFMQFSQNETDQDFSAITYMLFHNYTQFTHSANKSEFMRDCERNYSTWTFSGGFRTWVKMSLVRTSGKRDEAVEFRQESTVVKFNDKRPESERTNELFFAVFEWRDPFMQEIRLIVTANPWNSVAILCGVFMALFKVANFAKLSIQWIIRMRKRHLRNKTRELNQID